MSEKSTASKNVYTEDLITDNLYPCLQQITKDFTPEDHIKFAQDVVAAGVSVMYEMSRNTNTVSEYLKFLEQQVREYHNLLYQVPVNNPRG